MTGRAGHRHAGALAAALVAIAAAVAACGGSTAGPAAHLTAYQRELSYAECMRAHGMPGFPDPQSGGTFISTRANAGDFTGPRYLSANGACAHLEGPQESTAQFQRDVRQALELAACMRAHGIANFQATVQGDQIAAGAQGPGPSSPQFQSAQRACRRFMGGGS